VVAVAVTELLSQAAAELRCGIGVDRIQVMAAKVGWLLSLLRRAGDTHGVALPPEVVAGIDGCAQWEVRLAETGRSSPTPSDAAVAMGTLLDQAAKELDETATVAVLAASAAKLADLLATARQVAAAGRLPVPRELGGVIQGLNTWALRLAASWHLGECIVPSDDGMATG